MSDEDALLSAIAADPAEDTPRLAYADWLDEHDRPVRAEFIRVQCAVKPLERLPPAEQRPHVRLWRREAELLDNHRRDLLGPLGDDLTYFDVVFDRGFPARLTLDAATFLRHAPAVAALRPLPGVRVWDAAAFLPRLAGGYAGVISALEMQSDRRPDPTELSPEDVGVLTGRPWERLAELSLENCRVGDDGLARLAAGRAFPALEAIDLSGNEITDDGVRALVASSLWPRLRRLVLGGNPLTDESAGVLADAAAAGRVEYLNVRFTNLGGDGHRLLLRDFGGKVDLF